MLKQFLDNNLMKMHGAKNNVKFKYTSMSLIIQEIRSSNFQANSKAEPRAVFGSSSVKAPSLNDCTLGL
jgi:hypothetical protein